MQLGQGKDRQNGHGLCVLKFVLVVGRWELTDQITQLGQGIDGKNGHGLCVLKTVPVIGGWELTD